MFRQKPPGEGGPRKPAQFSYYGPCKGQNLTGWLAGPIQWIQCHTHKDLPSKPCLDWITHGKLACPRCNPKWHVEDLGYTPVYLEGSHAETLFVLREPARDLTEGLQFLDYLSITRGTGKVAPMSVARMPKNKKFVTVTPSRKQPADLEYSLLTLWKINELTEWMRMHGSTVPPVKITPDTVTEEPEEPRPVRLDVGKIVGILDSNAERNHAQADRESQIAAQLRRWQTEGKNGKADHK